MKLVVVESPYRGHHVADADDFCLYCGLDLDVKREDDTCEGETEVNIEFARDACMYVASLGHAPLASHLFCTQFLDDTDPDERQAGIDIGIAWSQHADEAWFFLQPGRHELSEGMKLALKAHRDNGKPCRFMHLSVGEFVDDYADERFGHA